MARVFNRLSHHHSYQSNESSRRAYVSFLLSTTYTHNFQLAYSRLNNRIRIAKHLYTILHIIIMKFILASIVVVGTVSAKTGNGSIISKKDITATTNGLRGQDKQQHQNRKIQALDLDGGEDFEEALAELFGDIPDVESLSQDPDADTDTFQGLDINELVEDLLDSNGDSAFSGGLLGDLLGDGNGGDSTSSGLLDFLGMDMYACSDTCKEEDKGVCDSFMMSMNPTTVFEDACNTGCIPQVRLDTCAQFCSDDDAAANDVDTAVVAVAEKRGMFDSLVQDLMCSDCKFYTCCIGDGGTYDTCKNELATDVNDQATGDSILSDLFEDLSGSLGGSIVDIDNILEDLPDLSSLFPSDTDSSGLADTTTDWDIQELLDQMLAALGLEDLFSGIQDLFDEEAMTTDFETIADTVTCDPDSCPIEGLCTGDLDFSNFKPDDLCTQNAFFSCGDGLNTLCEECTAGDRDGLICNLCSIATCCQDGNSSFQECALSSPLAQGLVQDGADTVDVAAVPEDDTESAEAAPSSEDQTEVESPEETSEKPQDDLNTDGVEGVTEPLVPSQVISSVEAAASASSYVTTTMHVVLAGVVTLFLSL